jgi:malonyl-CoA decarboxylase
VTRSRGLLGLAVHYYLRAKGSGGRPIDPVARFHLGNGARLERLNWLGDTSEKGLREAAGLMVNYLYDLHFIEANHEAFANHGTVVASDASLCQPQRRRQGVGARTREDLTMTPTALWRARRRPATGRASR